MKVKIYDHDANGTEMPPREAHLWECFPDDNDPEYQLALDALKRDGRYWTGGGAAPLVLLVKET